MIADLFNFQGQRKITFTPTTSCLYRPALAVLARLRHVHSFIRDSSHQDIITTLKDAHTLESPAVQVADYKSSLSSVSSPIRPKKSSFYLYKMEVRRLKVITQLWRGLLTFLQMSLDPPHLTPGQQITV